MEPKSSHYEHTGSSDEATFNPGPAPGQGKPVRINGVFTQEVEYLEGKVKDLGAAFGVADITLDPGIYKRQFKIMNGDRTLLESVPFEAVRSAVEFAFALYDESMETSDEEPPF